MSGKLFPVSVAAPGSFGLNKQNSFSLLDWGWAVEALNCVIDINGRLASRKGWTQVTSSPLGGSPSIVQIKEFVKKDGTTALLSSTATTVYSGTTTLTQIGTGFTNGNWQISNLNDTAWFFQSGEVPQYYDGTTFGTIATHSGFLDANGVMAKKPNVCISAFGRLWAADCTGDKTTLYWSDLLLGAQWSGGSSGSLDTTKLWPGGVDQITALAEFNGRLIIFGKRNILIYTGATDPTAATFALEDIVQGIGCVARDSVQNIGTDIIFYSNSGLRILSRSLRYKTMPLGDMTKNVRDFFLSYANSETASSIRSVYHEPEGFYLITLPTSSVVFCVDLRFPNDDGSPKITYWNNMAPTAFASTIDKTLYIGQAGVLGKYNGYNDNTAQYLMRYHSVWTDLGQPVASYTKIPKKFIFTVIGGNNYSLTYKWGYDYNDSFISQDIQSSNNTTVSEWNTAKYNIDSYSSGTAYSVSNVSPSGYGKVLRIGIESYINGYQLSAQKLDILTKLGRLT